MTMLGSGKDRDQIRSWTNRFWSLDLQIVIRSIFYYFSTGLYEYCLYYIPQLRFKNQQAIITESTNETAAPFIQFFFKEWIIISSSMPCKYHTRHIHRNPKSRTVETATLIAQMQVLVRSNNILNQHFVVQKVNIKTLLKIHTIQMVDIQIPICISQISP